MSNKIPMSNLFPRLRQGKKDVPQDADLHYFDLDEAPKSDLLLSTSKRQGYVPDTCLLNGAIVIGVVKLGNDPCAGCAGPREKCLGRPRKS